MRSAALLLGLWLAAVCDHAAAAGGVRIPTFEATALTGEKVSSDRLLGHPTILIVTPSKQAAGDTRAWAKALRKAFDPARVQVRDVLCIDLPFFMSEQDALGRAREKIPKRYHDQTWLFAQTDLENALGIPTGSPSAFVLVLDSKGVVEGRVEGGPNDARVAQIETALKSLR